MDQPRRKGADEAFATGEILLWHPFVERAWIGEILLDLSHQLAPVEIARRIKRLVGDHVTRQDVRRTHAINAFGHELVLGIADAFAREDEEIDDLRQRHVEQRRHFGARRDKPVERDSGRGEGDAQVTRTLRHIAALKQFAAQEEGGGDDVVCISHHDTPRT
jgi:hypothetical protein